MNHLNKINNKTLKRLKEFKSYYKELINDYYGSSHIMWW